jgi:hypothetical protein
LIEACSGVAQGLATPDIERTPPACILLAGNQKQ